MAQAVLPFKFVATEMLAANAGLALFGEFAHGYMPIIGRLAEAGVIIHDEFCEGNTAHATWDLGTASVARHPETDQGIEDRPFGGYGAGSGMGRML